MIKTNALLRAAYEGNTELMVKMINDGIPVHVANQGGLQAIHFAAKAGRVEVIDELIVHGADVDARSTAYAKRQEIPLGPFGPVTDRGNTPLHVASLLGQAEVVKLLLRRGANVNALAECNDDEFSPLYMAAQVGHQEIVTLMLAHGADPTITTSNGCTPCDVAQQQGFKAVAELLAEYEKRMNGEGTDLPSGDQNGDEHSQDGASGAEAEDKMTSEVVMHREIPVRKPRPKSGPPPVCQEAIPSPKPSPLKTKNGKTSP